MSKQPTVGLEGVRWLTGEIGPDGNFSMITRQWVSKQKGRNMVNEQSVILREDGTAPMDPIDTFGVILPTRIPPPGRGVPSIVVDKAQSIFAKLPGPMAHESVQYKSTTGVGDDATIYQKFERKWPVGSGWETRQSCQLNFDDASLREATQCFTYDTKGVGQVNDAADAQSATPGTPFGGTAQSDAPTSWW
jgi:hypothetical protein